MRGYYGIGVFRPKTNMNVGTLWRSAKNFEASFLFTIGRRYKKEPMDTEKSWRTLPLWNFTDFDDFRHHIPYDCPLVGVELTTEAHNLPAFVHPQRCIYLLGAEDDGIPPQVLARCRYHVKINTPRSLNVGVAGSIIMYDRQAKEA